MSRIGYTPLSGNTYDTDYRSYFTYTGKNLQNQALNSYSSNYNIAEENVYSKQKWIHFFCTKFVIFFAYLIFITTLPFSALFTFKLVKQYERFIVYRLGRLQPVKGPGLVLVLPCIDRFQKIDMRTKAFNVPPSRICTSDGYIISVGAIVQFRISDPLLMSISIQNIDHAMRDSAMSDMINLLSKKSFSFIKSKRQTLAYDLQMDVNYSCREWGIELSRVELSDVTVVTTPQSNPSFTAVQGGISANLDGSTTLNGIAQIAQQFFSNTTISEKPPTVNIREIISKIESTITPELTNEVNASYEFDLGENGIYFLDLTPPVGSVGAGNLPNGNPDVKLTLSLDVLQNLFRGKISATQAYVTGKLSICGNVSLAKKLDRVLNLCE